MIRLLAKWEKSYACWILLGIAVIFFFLRLPSLFEPYWYGDEGIYQAIGDSLSAGKLLYVETWDNKPPLLYVLYALLGSDQFLVRLASLIAGLVSLFLMFELTRIVLKNSRIALLVAGIFALLYGSPLFEGIIANAENFIMPLVLLAAIMLYKFSTSHAIRKSQEVTTQKGLSIFSEPYRNVLFFIGFLLGIAFLFKIVAVFDLFAFLFFLFLLHIYDKKQLVIPFSFINQAFWMTIGFVVPFLISAIYFFFNNALGEYITAAFFSNVGYVNYGNNLVIPQGLLLVKVGLLLLALSFLTVKRTLFTKAMLFILVWFSFSLFNAYFSQRPYTHYLLVLLPSYMLLFGLLFLNDSKRKFFIVLFLITTFFAWNDFDHFPLAKLSRYYGNFMQFVIGQKSAREYQAFFDGNTPSYYDLSAFLKSHTNPGDPIFIWGNVAQLYTLSDTTHTGRYTVAYHITGKDGAVKETNTAIASVKPKYIVVFEKPSLPELIFNGYAYKATIGSTTIYERL